MPQITRALVATLLLFAIAPAALAQPRCAAGRDAAGARIQLPSGSNAVTSLVQFAWDGGARIVEVCNLTGNATSLATWRLYSGEVDAAYPGICVGVSYAGGAMQYSCASPRTVSTAFNAPNDMPNSVLRFQSWSAGLSAR